MKRISIDPITRLEGHGKIDIFLNDQEEVADCYFIVPELRGFEKFCVGRPVEEMPRITSRICGVCSEAHHLCSAKACDAVYGVDIPPAAKKLRELLYSAFYTGDHATHFYILAGPDFVMGPEAPVAERNIIGMIGKLGVDVGKKVIGARAAAHEIVKILGGKTIHMVTSIPGGVTKGVNTEERDKIIQIAKDLVEFGKFTLQVLNDLVLKNKEYLDLILSDTYTHQLHSMGTVDDNNHTNFYHGKVRVVDCEGQEIAKYDSGEYLQHVAEHVEQWSYLKFPFLKAKGWQGFIEGQESGLYRATPLSRLNASDGMATLLVTTEEKAREISPRPEIQIGFVAKTEVRTDPSLMPEAPAFAVQKLLDKCNLTMDDIAVAKNHNPFAVNDAIFGKILDYDWNNLNKTGSPLVWGHPQGPTLTRVLIEALEEAVDLGGGKVLIFGCAAGDVGIAALFEVA